MTQRQVLYTGYYSLLGVIVLTAVVQTLIQVGGVVWYGQKVAELEVEKRAMLQQQQQLQLAVAQASSLDQLAIQAQNQQYTTIIRPIAISHQTNVAAR